MDNAPEYVIEMLHITKEFPGIKANDDITLQLRRGEIHALLGENGAGKSTLMSVLFGLYQPDEGVIKKDGKEVQINDPNDATALHIGMVHQHFKLIDVFTVLDNIILGAEDTRLGFLSRKAAREKVLALSERYGLKVDLDAKIEDITVGMQQRVEILKALYRGADLLILDEPTASLTAPERERLFEVMRTLKKQRIGMIFITHFLDEVFAVCDKVVVLRNSEKVCDAPVTEVTKHEIEEHMVGHSLEGSSFSLGEPDPEVALRVTGLESESFADINFEVHKGEILGVAGLIGAGRTELMESIFGLRKCGGTIEFMGETFKRWNTQQLIKKGMVMIPEDRKNLALDLRAKISDNIALGVLDRLCNSLGFVDKAAEQKLCQEQKERFRIKTHDMSLPANSLSGGNQQKVVLAKWLSRDVDVLILDEPTRGIDVGSKEEIHRLIVELAREGKAIIMISSELPEVLGMSDRILVMYEGRCMGIVEAKDATQEKVMALSFGHEDRNEEAIEDHAG